MLNNMEITPTILAIIITNAGLLVAAWVRINIKIANSETRIKQSDNEILNLMQQVRDIRKEYISQKEYSSTISSLQCSIEELKHDYIRNAEKIETLLKDNQRLLIEHITKHA